jgi:hypothetical protein
MLFQATRPQAKGFSDLLKRQLRATDPVDGTGKPLAIRAEVDRSRIDATGERMARGLYYYLAREPLRRDSQAWVYSKPGYGSIDFIVPNLNAILEKCGDRTHGQIGSGLGFVARRMCVRVLALRVLLVDCGPSSVRVARYFTVEPPQLDPAPAVQPKQWRPTTIDRASSACIRKSRMC